MESCCVGDERGVVVLVGFWGRVLLICGWWEQLLAEFVEEGQ